ncbi:neural Wiskott-Aldrich syndrome protein-like [Coccinella septempunctata]|uniref:neural Wiskott-Aldrich syndrome protein-like n=1 Tax=Coccinella septempunctata TaxID=41139 RepID=UPI001D08B9D4|nr:neural Wiskott-Aldrich syndrome protein-like [Coccinella septempunctata]
MKMPPTVEVENKSSKLLNSEENSQIFRLLGNRCQTLSTAVIQLFLTEAPSHSYWIRRDTGVLCFVKDNIRKNYFFRLFCLRRNNMIWEHEMYNNLEYSETTSFFHVFEGQDSLVAFNFANLEEAREMKRIVDVKIYAKRKKEERRRQYNKNSNSVVDNSVNNLKPTNPQDFVVRKVPDLAAKQAKRKRNITKADIGSPQDFKHLSHVGWNPDSGFDVDGVNDQLKKFFAKAGVSEKELQDKETREFIYGFINERGGFDAVKKENIESSQSNKVNNSISSAPLPVPPVPPRGPGKPHVRAAPPPPPSGPPGRPAAKTQPDKPSLPTNTISAPPSAPPPPPLPTNLMPTVPPLNEAPLDTRSVLPPVDMNAALLQSIRDGTTLKPIEERKVAAPIEARNDLLCEIRKGFSLKPVQEREVKQLNQPTEVGPTDLAGALARALAERSKAIHSEDDDSEDEDSNDDEWDC